MNQEGNGKSIPGGESGFVGEIPRQVWSDTGPPQGWSSPPPSYSETYPQQAQTSAEITNVVHIMHPVIYGSVPVQTRCPFCSRQVVTKTESDTSATAWILAGVLCFVGLWCCAPLPLFSESMKHVAHRCPACSRVIARYENTI